MRQFSAAINVFEFLKIGAAYILSVYILRRLKSYEQASSRGERKRDATMRAGTRLSGGRVKLGAPSPPLSPIVATWVSSSASTSPWQQRISLPCLCLDPAMEMRFSLILAYLQGSVACLHTAVDDKVL